MFRFALALVFCSTIATGAYGISSGFYECGQHGEMVDGKLQKTGEYSHPENHDVCEEIIGLLHHAEQKIFINMPEPQIVQGFVQLDEAKPASKKGESMVIWFQTNRGPSVESYLPDAIETIMQRIRKIQHQINALGYSRVLMIAPGTSNSHLGIYVPKDTKKDKPKSRYLGVALCSH